MSFFLTCRYFFVLLLFLCSLLSANPLLISVSRIWDKAEHQAFTSLIEFQGNFYCAFREGDLHAGGKNGTIRLLKSTDGSAWTSAALLKKEGKDLRDPSFSIMPDGRLMLTMGGSTYQDDKLFHCHPQVAFSPDGNNWSEIVELERPEEWIWKVVWHKGKGYGAAYHLNPQDMDEPWTLTLLTTPDGLEYAPVAALDVPDYPSEAALSFLSDDTMVAMVRRDGNGWLGVSKPPYQSWKWVELKQRLGGPHFVILPTGEMWLGSRHFITEGAERKACTALSRVTLDSSSVELVLPSGGDTGYPGMIYKDGMLYLSYYSAHEGKSCIYFAIIRL